MVVLPHNSNPHLYTLLPHHNTPGSILKSFKLRACSSCNCTIQVTATRYKRKPRPSFFEQIHNKWSFKHPSTREKFPWQEREEEQDQYQHLLEAEEEEIENKQVCEVVVSEPEYDASPSVRSTVPNHLSSAPWIHGTRRKETHFDSQHKREDNSINGFPGHCEDKEEIVEKELSCSEKIKDKTIDFVDVSVEVAGDEQSAIVKDFDGAIHSKGETFGDNLDFGDNCNSSLSGLPWKREYVEGQGRRTRSNTSLAEKILPEHELKRLRNVALRMLERIKVGAAGIRQELVDAIHEKWRLDEVVKLKFEEPHSCNMKRTHEILESRTGGLVIWRSGSSVVLYRGMDYKFRCVQSYTQKNEVDMDIFPHAEEQRRDDTHNGGVRIKEPFIPSSAKYLKGLSQEELMDFSELNHLLDELGPRFKDWCGREPLPVDADLLPPVVPGYKPPLRLLPYGVRPSLRDKEMTILRRIARTMPPHFALGRSRELQGLAKSMVILWERSAIAKIAIKRGVENTRNDRMAEELKRLTGGVLLSRNKDYIVLYRGNDFLPPAVSEALKERRKLNYIQQDGEEHARQMALTFFESNGKTAKGAFVAGTLAETMAATSRWGNLPSSDDREGMMRNSALAKCASLVQHLENKLAVAKGKLKKSEKALANVQESLEPTELPTDLETITDEERFLFRRMGLSMKPFLLLGRRGVYDGTIENMHLHWKYRELVKIIVYRKNLAQVKHIAVSLEAESGGVLVSVDRTTKGYEIIVYRGKNYQCPYALRPPNLLTRRQALARSIELQRREGLKHHVADLQERLELIKSELEELEAGKKVDLDLHLTFDDSDNKKELDDHSHFSMVQ